MAHSLEEVKLNRFALTPCIRASPRRALAMIGEESATIQAPINPRSCGILQYPSARSQLQYVSSDTRRISESDPKSSPQSV